MSDFWIFNRQKRQGNGIIVPKAGVGRDGRKEGLVMAYGTVSFEKRIKENIRNYRLKNLYDEETFQRYLKHLAELLEVDILITDRHGEKAFVIGNFQGFVPDVVREPGRKLRLEGRTVGHVYYKLEKVAEERQEAVRELLEDTVDLLEQWGYDSYVRKETAIYADELEKETHKGMQGLQHAEREDVLTGVLEKNYFENRIQVIDRSEIVPVAVICANINDWKFVNDHFGEEESDRLIQVVADFLKEEAKQDYVIGRTDGDVFYVVIPMPEEQEAEDYCYRVTGRCQTYLDPHLAPSVAFGCVYKENVEESIAGRMSDAEYEMFEHKMAMKKAPGYRERLESKIEKCS